MFLGPLLICTSTVQRSVKHEWPVIIKAGLYDQRFNWSNWVIESDDILQSWSTFKLLSDDGNLLTKCWSYKPSEFTSLIKVGDIQSNVTVD